MNYAYANNNLLNSITRGANVVSFAYDGANRPDTTTLPGGAIEDYTFDAASQISQILYKKNATTTNGIIQYSYDGAGRRQGVFDGYARMGLPAATTANAVYDLNNRLTSWSGTTLTYDNNGNLLSHGSQTYTFNARNQLTATSGGSATFAYDGLGRRSSKVVGPTTTKFLYDGANVVQEKDGAGAVTANEIVGLGVDQTFWRNAGANRNLYHDALGSTLALTTNTGTINTSYTYEPYGRQTATVSDTNPFQFTGREWDGATGLQFNRARSYNPAYGRFISEDPIGLTSGPNVYSYAFAAPTMYRDPTGLFIKEILSAVVEWIGEHGWQIAGAIVTVLCVPGGPICAVAAGGLFLVKEGLIWYRAAQGPGFDWGQFKSDTSFNVVTSAPGLGSFARLPLFGSVTTQEVSTGWGAGCSTSMECSGPGAPPWWPI